MFEVALVIILLCLHRFQAGLYLQITLLFVTVVKTIAALFHLSEDNAVLPRTATTKKESLRV